MVLKDVINNSYASMWVGFTNFLPKIILAIVLLFVGFILAWIGDAIARKIIRVLKVDAILQKIGLMGMFEKAGLKISFSRLLGGVVYWFVLAVFLAAAVNVLGLTQIADFLNKLVAYLPNVVAAVAILVIGLLIGHFLSNIVHKTTEAAGITSSKRLASLTKWSIFVFALIAALVQLKVAPDLLRILFAGFVAMLAVAGGLAFGLGGKDAAKEIVDKLSKK